MANVSSTFDSPGTEAPLSQGGDFVIPVNWGEWRVAAGNAYIPTSYDSAVAHWSGSPSIGDDQESKVTLHTYTNGPGVGGAVRIKGTAAGDGDCYIAQVVNDTEGKIFRVDDDGSSLTFVQQGTDVAVSAVGASDVVGAEIDSAGDITLVINGSDQFTENDTTYTTGQPGPYGYENPSDVLIISLWEAGDLAAPPAGIPIFRRRIEEAA